MFPSNTQRLSLKSPHSLIVIPFPTCLSVVSMGPWGAGCYRCQAIKGQVPGSFTSSLLVTCQSGWQLTLGAASQRGLSLRLFCQPDVSHQRISLSVRSQEGEKTEEACRLCNCEGLYHSQGHLPADTHVSMSPCHSKGNNCRMHWEPAQSGSGRLRGPGHDILITVQ